jgi:tetratricopeptide (TPR) repeat protein
VQHAHQKGIIHRDLKPSNVLVTLHDGRPVPKVIDFGIAKATNQRLTEKTLFTEFRQFIGTPQYMSPEQAEMSGLDVDTRSDVYSLGVLLYELLTGTTPFAAETLRAAGYSEMQRMIREEDPPRPSERVSTMGAPLTGIAKHRAVEPSSLPKLIRGDLDWIVMKSIEKDRTHRYDTANDLAADIQRHLKREPVLASPPRLIYKLQKFMIRNRGGVMAAFATAAALLFGLALATAGFLRASREAERASQEAIRATEHAAAAKAEAARSQAIADFLQEIVASVDPEDAARRQLDVGQVIPRARELFGNDHATVAAMLSSLALQLQHSGNLAAAEPLYGEALRIGRSIYGDRHASVGLTLARLGSLLRLKGDDDAAEETLRDAIEAASDRSGGSTLATCDARIELAEILKRRGRFDEAEVLVRESLHIRQAHGRDFEFARTLEQLHAILTLAGKDDEAEPVLHQLIDVYRDVVPQDSLTAAWIYLGSGLWLRQRGRAEQGERYLRKAVQIYRLHPNPPRELYLQAVDGLYQTLRNREESFEEVVTLFHEAVENMAYVYGRDHLLIAPQLLGFAQELEKRERATEAIPLIIDGIRIHRNARGDNWDATGSLEMLDRFVRRVVLAHGLSTDQYEVAARGAELIVMEQNQPRYRCLLGMAQFRLGKLGDAISNLSVSTSYQEPLRDLRLQQLAFLAMAQFQSGQLDIARRTFGDLRELLADDTITTTKQTRAVLVETESLLVGNSANDRQ